MIIILISSLVGNGYLATVVSDTTVYISTNLFAKEIADQYFKVASSMELEYQAQLHLTVLESLQLLQLQLQMPTL